MASPEQPITRLLAEVPSRPAAMGELLPLLYDQLRAIAAQRMRQERAGHTLQATALVHEAYLKVLGNENAKFEGRGHFFRAAAQAMRRILIDHARVRDAEKRGGGKAPVTIDAVDLAFDSDPAALLALDEAMTALAAEDARAAEVVQLRFFSGLDFDEIADVLGVSRRTIMREWAFARARLVELIEGRPNAAD